MTIEDLPPTLTVEAAGKLLGLSRSSAYRAAERGELPTLQLAGRLHVPTARLMSMLGYELERAPQTEAPAS
jgi:excisionase family DNA binding protein